MLPAAYVSVSCFNAPRFVKQNACQRPGGACCEPLTIQARDDADTLSRYGTIENLPETDNGLERRSPTRQLRTSVPTRRIGDRRSGFIAQASSPESSGAVPAPGTIAIWLRFSVWRRDAADTRSRDGCATSAWTFACARA